MTQLGYSAGGTQAAFGAGETVISGYFAGQMAGMILSGIRARKLGWEQNVESISFQQKMNEIKHMYTQERNQKELDFFRDCHESGMKFQREYARKSYMNRQQEEEFRKFCESSWQRQFRPTIGAVLAEMKSPDVDVKGVAKMKIMLARTPVMTSGMKRRGAYTEFCEFFKNKYILKSGLNVDCTWLQAWERDCMSVIADTMNLHYIMQGIPTIVLYLVQRGKNLSLETATWGYQLGLNSMAFDKTFCVPLNEYEFDAERQALLLMAAIAYIDDCYRVLLCQSSPQSFYKIKNDLQKDKYIWEKVCQKYQSLIETTELVNKKLFQLENKEIEELKSAVQI